VTALAGRVALVTGASRGIGAAVVDALLAAGAQVVGVARTMEPGSRPGLRTMRCDVTVAGEVEELGRQVLNTLGPPDIVVNSAGGFLLRPLAATTISEFDGQVAVNLRAAFALARTFLPAMSDAERGCFISMGSVADHFGFPENAAYAASKYGLRGLHETLVAEYRGRGVRLTLISPGPTDTSIWDSFDPDHREGFPSRSAMLRPADVAEAVVFVATRPPHVHIEWLRLGPA
jgi:NAD(P)-dependent dehydrogenase (short-subunit alcohol dehydrogenase family)